MVIHPAPAGSGIWFARRAGGRVVRIPARLDRAAPSHRCTVLCSDGVAVSTVEHLLAALTGLGIRDAEIRLRGAEVPIMDGSSAPFVRALLRASEPAGHEEQRWTVTRAVTAGEGPSRCHLLPGRRLELWCQVDFAVVGRQCLRYVHRGAESFTRRLAPARTFGFLSEAARLRRAGLARGASLGSVLVFHEQGVLNPGGSRFADEPVRHKLLDALGDLALLGGPLRARIKLVQCSHRLLTATLRGAIQKGWLVRG